MRSQKIAETPFGAIPVSVRAKSASFVSDIAMRLVAVALISAVIFLGLRIASQI